MAILNNNNRITFGSFLAYFVMSAIISPLGVISGPVAEHFHISLTAANASFTYLTSGIFIGALVAVFIFDYIKLRQIVIGGVAIICLSLYAIYAVDDFQVFKLSLSLIGVSCGVELSGAAVVIAKIYDERLRASMLLLTDSFYSMAGVISTTLAGMLLAREFHWSSAYLLAFVVSLGIATVAMLSRYPATVRSVAKRPRDAGESRWPLSVHLVGASTLVYLVVFVMIYSWVPSYAQQALGLSVEASSEVVSRFFLGLFIGQLFMFVLVLKFPVPVLIVACASSAMLLSVSLWTVHTALQLQFAMFALGLTTGGLFKTVLSYGTTAVRQPTAKMVSYLIFYSGLGTAIAPFVGSLVVDQFSIIAALQFVTVGYALTLALILLALRQRRR